MCCKKIILELPLRVHDGGTLPPDKPVNFIGGKMSAKIVQTFLAVLEAIDDQRCDNQCDPVVQAVATIKACVSVAQLQQAAELANMAMDDGEWEMAFDQGYKAGKEAGEFLDPDNETPI